MDVRLTVNSEYDATGDTTVSFESYRFIEAGGTCSFPVANLVGSCIFPEEACRVMVPILLGVFLTDRLTDDVDG